MSDLHLRLAGVTRLSLHGRGVRDAFVFDPHRLALPCWALALEDARVDSPATLLTFDRHFDLVPPLDRNAVPDRSAGVLALDAHARTRLDVRNVDHVLAAVEANVLGEVIAIARSSPRGATDATTYRDRRGRSCPLRRAGSLAEFFERKESVPSGPLLLDVDVDCFTTPSADDPTEVLGWTEKQIRDELMPPGSEAFWGDVLARTVALTVAREPYHCGGLIAAGRLFERMAQVLWCELLRADLP